MRRPETIETLYLDFDGFFASVMQQAMPEIRNRPVGVIPFEISMEALLDTQPKQMRALWGNVNGERMWYALHGYDIKAEPTGRGMYGHGRVLPPGMAATTQSLRLCSIASNQSRQTYAPG